MSSNSRDAGNVFESQGSEGAEEKQRDKAASEGDRGRPPDEAGEGTGDKLSVSPYLDRRLRTFEEALADRERSRAESSQAVEEAPFADDSDEDNDDYDDYDES